MSVISMRALADGLAGSLIRPEDPEYHSVRKPFIGRFEEVLPRAVVRCGAAQDVVAALAFARAHAMPIALRSGGQRRAGPDRRRGPGRGALPHRVRGGGQRIAGTGRPARPDRAGPRPRRAPGARRGGRGPPPRLPGGAARRSRDRRPAAGRPARPATVQVGVFGREPPAAAITALVSHFARDRVRGELRDLELVPWGGAIGRVPATATAYAHRHPAYLVKQTVYLGFRASDARRRAAHRWVTGSWATLHRWGTGLVYPNYPDPAVPAWDPAYLGANLTRLRRVKARYDPGNLLRTGA